MKHVTTNGQPLTWILVMNGTSADIYTLKQEERHIPLAGNAKHHHYEDTFMDKLMRVPGMHFEAESVDEYELGKDTTGKLTRQMGSARSKPEPHIEVHKEIKQHFAAEVAKQLEDANHHKRFEQLVIVASPEVLGELRRKLDSETCERVKAEVAKDLTGYQEEVVVEHVERVLFPGRT